MKEMRETCRVLAAIMLMAARTIVPGVVSYHINMCSHTLSLYLDGTRDIALHSQLTNTKNIEVESFVDTFGD